MKKYLPLYVFAVALVISCASVSQQSEPCSVSAGGWAGELCVKTLYGCVEGQKDKNNTLSWLGVPYARAPVGDLRWRAPKPPLGWEGVRRARGFAKSSPQLLKFIFTSVTGAEDCLYLNLWRPDSKKQKLPVYVWLHGGGNSIGSANHIPDYYGYPMASALDVVFVSINYRLNILGWFTHPALREGQDEKDASGNYGTLDIIQALTWIQDNIEAFGGDPQNVVIAGQSAGAVNVLSMLMTPLADGLFSKAVAQSPYRNDYSQEDCDAYANTVVRRLLVETGGAENEESADELLATMSNLDLASWLRSVPFSALITAMGDPLYGPMVDFPYLIKDGAVIPKNGFDALSERREAGAVPLIIGSTKEETKIFLLLSSINFRSVQYKAYCDYTTARWKARGVDAVADALSAHEGDSQVFVYRFDWGAPDVKGQGVMPTYSGKMLGAFHLIDVPFFLGRDELFGDIVQLPLFTKKNKMGRVALQKDIFSYLDSFIHTGNPNSDSLVIDGVETRKYVPVANLPYWESWKSIDQNPVFMVLNADFQSSKTQPCRGRLTIADLDHQLDYWPEPLRSQMREHLEKRDWP